MTRRIRFEGIDFLKAFAILGVICLHVAGSYYNVGSSGSNSRSILNPIKFYYYLGTLSIPLFFCVNGFLVLGKKKVTFKYILKKVALLLSPVFLWSFSVSFAKLLLRRELVNPIASAIGYLMQEGLFFQFWFIGSLVIVQLLSPWLNWVLREHRHLFETLMLILGAICIAINFISYCIGYPLEKFVLQTFRLWTWLFYFMLGAWLRNTDCKFQMSKNKRLTCFACIILVVQIGSIISSIMLRDGYAEYDYDAVFVMISIFVLMLLYRDVVILGRNRIISRLVHVFSNNTMGIFILHVLVLKVAFKALPISEQNWAPVVIIIVFLVSSFLTSCLKRVPFISRFVSTD